ncbi:MAG: glutathione peroxidase [Rhizobiales bacterium]|nr:glutathione peroxidase [Hyphomicrobiales bacterium]
MSQSLYDIPLKTIDGKAASLADYKGDVMLIVNVASKCGLTPQYDGLEKLYAEHKAEGFDVLGFPCNQFMGQEPGTEAEIAEFCRLTYGVEFPMFAKIDVNGPGRHPLYKALIDAQPADGDIRWNFEKFLVSRDGKVVARFAPKTEPEDPTLVAAIEAEISKPR